MSIYRGAGGASDTTDQATVTEVTQKAAEAAASASSAASSASSAATSATTASSAATTATNNASTSTTNATNAAASASTASTAATNASNSATAAAASETNAAASEAAALASSTSASNSAASATTSASAAGTSASAAQSAYADTLAIQGAAATSATNAATSATAAAASATAAATSATTAATEASNAATSATSSATYSTLAAGHAASAEAAEAATLALFDQFGDQYLGAISADPITDNGGDALTVGDVYFNTTDNVLKFYNGTSWTAPEDVASTAAANALASQTAAATSATSAATSASQASASASAASSSASSASTSATNASNSAASAAASETSAEGHKDLAYTYWQNAASAVTYSDLEAIAASKAVTAVDVFVYDTRKDSDGGAWRKRTQHTSWYNETLNTATRGARKEFPAVAVIVAEATKVTIYDGDDPTLPMWMVFNSNIDNIIRGAITSITCINGTLVQAAGSGFGITLTSFIEDSAKLINVSIQQSYNGNISSRNDLLDHSTISGSAIVNGTVNDVAMTVLPNAPIDPATQLPIPTIAVATDGGVSVIKDDGTVVDSASTTAKAHIAFSEDGTRLAYSESTDDIVNIANLSAITTDGWAHNLRLSDGGGTPDLLFPDGFTDGLAKELAGMDGQFAMGKGVLTILDENTTTPAEGMVNYITSSYNTGWMHGDVKGAFLSDTTAETVGVDETTELVTNGTFDTDLSGWTAGSSWSWVSGTASNTGTSYGSYLTQAPFTEVGKTYLVSFDYVSGSGGAVYIKVGAGSYVSHFGILSGTGTYTFVHRCVGLDDILAFAGTNTFTIDNISVKQTGNLVVNGTFDVDTSGWTASGSNLSVVSNQLNVVSVTPSTVSWAYQIINCEANKEYILTADFISGAANRYIYVGNGIGGATYGGLATSSVVVGTNSITFTPTASSFYLSLGTFDGTTPSIFDNISVRLAESDRSVNNNGLEVYGTVTKAPVASGNDLVAYSGFSTNNYLQQPYNSDLDFGTGDFYVMGWVKQPTSAAFRYEFIRDSISSSNRFYIANAVTTGKIRGVITDGSATVLEGSATFNGTWQFVCMTRSSGTAYLYVNGTQEASGASSQSVTNTSASAYLGVAPNGTSESNGSLTLWRIGAGAPTAEQIAKIYEDEKVLFQDGAQATLYGSSDAVTALAYDEVTDLLHVGTSAGRSVFSGLKRVENTTDAVGTAISAYDSLVVEE